MRWLAGFALLFAAAAALPQAAPETDLLHNRPNTKQEFEIRPGIRVCAEYGERGAVSRMSIRPTPRPGDAWRDSIPADTTDSIVREIVLSERHPMFVVKEFWLASCQGEQISSLEDLTTVGIRDCSASHPEIHLAVLDFKPSTVGRDGSIALDDSSVMLTPSEIAERVAILTATPSTWCAR